MRASKHWDPVTEKNHILPAFTLSIIGILLQCEINFSQNYFKDKRIFSCVHATLHPALLVRPLVRPSVRHTLLFMI